MYLIFSLLLSTSSTSTVNDPGGPNQSLTDDETTNVNNYGGFLSYDHLLTERLYVGGRVSGRHDEIAGVDYPEAAPPTVGYCPRSTSSATTS